MKTPDEIKCGLECIRTNVERICVKPQKGQCPRCQQVVGRNLELEAIYSQVSKALCGKENAIPEEILQVIDQVKAEFALAVLQRDAAAADAAIGTSCNTCLHAKNHPLTNPCMACGRYHNFWEWRGVCQDNTEVE